MPDPGTYPNPLPDPAVAPLTCPRCDRVFDSGVSDAKTLEMLKEHVIGQHPDHDIAWADD